MTAATQSTEDVAGDLLVDDGPAGAAAQPQGVMGELGPVAEVAMCSRGVDEGDQLRRQASRAA